MATPAAQVFAGALPQWAHMTPWAMSSPDQFRPLGPPALTSDQYAADVNEVKEIGSNSSATRTADQTQIAVFWTGNAPAYWNRAATAISDQRHLTLSENARLLALLNVGMADAQIYGGIHFRAACRDAQLQGIQIGGFVMANVAQSAKGKRTGQINHQHPQGQISGDGENSGNDQ